MRRWVIALIAVLGLSSLATAQTFSIGAGVSRSGDGYVGLHVMFTVGDLVRVDPVGLDARLGVNVYIGEGHLLWLSGTGAAVSPEVDLLGTFSFDDAAIYAGPAAQFGIFMFPRLPVETNAVGVIGGVRFQVEHFCVYLEGNLWFGTQTVGRARFGMALVF